MSLANDYGKRTAWHGPEPLPDYKAHAQRLAKALTRARQDLIDIKEDCDSGEFEIDPQFAIDRITEVLNQ